MKKINGYDLSRNWFDFCFENPEKSKPTHTTLYFYIIDRWNRFGQKDKFGLPTYHTMESIGIKSKNTYFTSFNFLVENNFIKLVEKSKNQNTANIISLCAVLKKESASKSALDSANIQQLYSDGVSTDPIDKQVNKETNKQLTIENDIKNSIDKVYKSYPSKCPFRNSNTGKGIKNREQIGKLLKSHSVDQLLAIIKNYITDCDQSKTFYKNFATFLNNLPEYEKPEPKTIKLKNFHIPHNDMFGISEKDLLQMCVDGKYKEIAI